MQIVLSGNGQLDVTLFGERDEVVLDLLFSDSATRRLFIRQKAGIEYCYDSHFVKHLACLKNKWVEDRE